MTVLDFTSHSRTYVYQSWSDEYGSSAIPILLANFKRKH